MNKTVFVFLLLSLSGCEKRPIPKTPGAKLIEKYECFRCHDGGEKWVSVDTDDGCVSCHVEILEGKQDNDFSLAQNQSRKERIVSYPSLPSLEGASRLRPEWIAKYLLNPHDLRPALKGMMPRLLVSDKEAKTLASFLSPKSNVISQSPRSGSKEKGRVLFENNACRTCHMFGGDGLKASIFPDGIVVNDMTNAIRLAPNLIHTRDRMTREITLAWLEAPKKFNSKTLMPTFVFSNTERQDLVAFLFDEIPIEVDKKAPFVQLPILERDIFYPEIEAKVFKHSCWHCHSTPRWFQGIDGGPGNAGGFGYPGKQIDLGNLHVIKKSAKILFSDLDGMPKLVRHMVARHDEVRGIKSDYLGMPLGLEPYPAETIQLVETWIQQGAR